jgi:short-subunit dehydrogenase
LKEVIKELGKYPVQTMYVPVDLSRAGQQQKLVSTVLKEFGRIDILINNAGLETEGAYLELPWEAIETTLDVNLVAPMALTYLVLPHMLERKMGHIVQIASVASGIAAPYAAVYCATKGGLSQWTRALRLELAGSGIHFSTIYPGYVTDVGMFAKFNIKAPTMLGSCTPLQVAQAVVRAIEKEEMERIVVSSPARLLFVLNMVSAPLGDWLAHKLGLVDFQRKKVKQLSKGVK